MGEAAARRAPLQFADLATRPSYPLRDITLAAGFRSVLIVPLLGAESVFGQSFWSGASPASFRNRWCG